MSPFLQGVAVLVLAAQSSSAASAHLIVPTLIEQLGSKSFEDREAATAALKAIGEPALRPLQEAAKLPDAEVRSRAERLVAAIEEQVRYKATKQLYGDWELVRLDIGDKVETAHRELSRRTPAEPDAGDRSLLSGPRPTE